MAQKELIEGDHVAWLDADGLEGSGVVTMPLTGLGYYVVQGYWTTKSKKAAGLIAVHKGLVV